MEYIHNCGNCAHFEACDFIMKRYANESGLNRATQACGHYAVQLKGILGDDYDLDWLRELLQADREKRCFVFPKDGMVYYIEEACGEKWIANKPIQQVTVKCGWGIASIEFSLFDTGKYFNREAAEAVLKGKQDGKED